MILLALARLLEASFVGTWQGCVSYYKAKPVTSSREPFVLLLLSVHNTFFSSVSLQKV